jgi:hypothetical protein
MEVEADRCQKEAWSTDTIAYAKPKGLKRYGYGGCWSCLTWRSAKGDDDCNQPQSHKILAESQRVSHKPNKGFCWEVWY